VQFHLAYFSLFLLFVFRPGSLRPFHVYLRAPRIFRRDTLSLCRSPGPPVAKITPRKKVRVMLLKSCLFASPHIPCVSLISSILRLTTFPLNCYAHYSSNDYTRCVSTHYPSTLKKYKHETGTEKFGEKYFSISIFFNFRLNLPQHNGDTLCRMSDETYSSGNLSRDRA